MDRLRASKSRATAQYTSSERSQRFEPDTNGIVATPESVRQATATTASEIPQAPINAPSSTVGNDLKPSEFTERLLEVKKRLRDNEQRPS
jgi:hypothetical protein